MDIRDWPIDRIMQLPDCCFGRRFPVFVQTIAAISVNAWDISELGLPERCVIWFLSLEWHTAAGSEGIFRLALGDQLPTAIAQVDALEPLMMGLGTQGAEPRQIVLYQASGYSNMPMRKPLAAAGRRLVLEVRGTVVTAASVRVGLIVSSIPTEVPDCLLSG